MNLNFDIEDSSILNMTDIEYKPSISKNLQYQRASILKYQPSISKFLHFCVLQYRSTQQAKTLTFNIEGLVFDIVHISISGIFASISKLGKVPYDGFRYPSK